MTKLSNITKQLFAVSLIVSVSSVAMAQGYYDDDIYYDASKKKTEQKKQPAAQQTATRASGYYVVGNNSASVVDYPSADTYVVPDANLDIDVDAYNRRGQFLVPDSIPAEDATQTDFAYTQRIERFHNPDVVSGSDDAELQEVYAYAMQQPQNINIYVIDNDPWNYFGPSWSWRYGSPWYWNAWGPSFSWGWNSWAWDPYWTWSWGWGPSWGPAWSWGPGWGGPALGPGWGHHHAWRPVTPSGSYRPHQYGGSGAVAAHRPGSYSAASASRPGNMGRGRYGAAAVTGVSSSRPGSYSPSAVNQSTSSSTFVRPGNSGRGRSAMTGTNNNSNNTRNTYNSSNSYRSSSSSSSSYRSSGSGFSGSRSSGGSASRGGGGASRGRR